MIKMNSNEAIKWCKEFLPSWPKTTNVGLKQIPRPFGWKWKKEPGGEMLLDSGAELLRKDYTTYSYSTFKVNNGNYPTETGRYEVILAPNGRHHFANVLNGLLIYDNSAIPLAVEQSLFNGDAWIRRKDLEQKIKET